MGLVHLNAGNPASKQVKVSICLAWTEGQAEQQIPIPAPHLVFSQRGKGNRGVTSER